MKDRQIKIGVSKGGLVWDQMTRAAVVNEVEDRRRMGKRREATRI